MKPVASEQNGVLSWHRKQKTFQRRTRWLTWVDLPVVSDAVRVDDILEDTRELVGPVVRGRGLPGLHAVQDGTGQGRTTLLLNNSCQFRPNQQQQN